MNRQRNADRQSPDLMGERLTQMLHDAKPWTHDYAEKVAIEVALAGQSLVEATGTAFPFFRHRTVGEWLTAADPK